LLNGQQYEALTIRPIHQSFGVLVSAALTVTRPNSAHKRSKNMDRREIEKSYLEKVWEWLQLYWTD